MTIRDGSPPTYMIMIQRTSITIESKVQKHAVCACMPLDRDSYIRNL